MLGYDFGYVTDLVDTKNGKNRFFIVTRFKFEFLHLNFSIWSSVFDGLSNESGLVPPRSGSSKLQLRHLRALLCNVPFSVLVFAPYIIYLFSSP